MSKPDNETPSEPSNALMRLLQEFRSGASLSELTKAMQSCVAAARDTGKPAELKYALKFTPSGNAIAVSDKVDVKLPTAQRDASIFFATEENTLSRDNPQQRNLDFRTVEKPKQEVVELPQRAAVAAQ